MFWLLLVHSLVYVDFVQTMINITASLSVHPLLRWAVCSAREMQGSEVVPPRFEPDTYGMEVRTVTACFSLLGTLRIPALKTNKLK
jgi:hypothetical protein